MERVEREIMTRRLNNIFATLVLLIGLAGCFKNEEYPPEPIISNPQFTFIGDSAMLAFDFTDGDGDIGLDPNDTVAPFNPDSYYHYNLHIEYFEKDDAEGWVQGTDIEGEPIVFQYRIQPIEVKGEAKGLKGTIEVNMINYKNTFSSESDTIRYSIKLIDKALNESNELESPEVVS
jgi:hypothetical protein